MKKRFVLIVLLCLASSFTLLAQKNKSDSINLAKKALQLQDEKKAADAKAFKAAADKLQKAKKDSLNAVAKTQKQTAEKNKKDNDALKSSTDKSRKDSISAVAKALKTSSKKGKPGSIASAPSDTLIKGDKIAQGKKEKGKSAKQLRKEAFNADPANFTEKQIALLGYKDFKIDKSTLVKRPDISFSKARPYILNDPNPTNIKFFHRYWRDVEVLDPANKALNEHHAVIVASLLSAVKKKEITAYSPVPMIPENPTGDAFTMPMRYDDMMAAFPESMVVDSIDKTTGNNMGSKIIATPFTPDKIYGYRIKEDVYYDKIRAVMITRIIGIAPLIKIAVGGDANVQPLCWLKFKDCRKIFVTIDVDPTKKIGTTMDDIFLQRRFASRIVEESNPLGQRIKDYKTELAAQQEESNRLEKKVAKFKKGSWGYVTTYGNGDAEPDVKPATKTKKPKVKVPSPAPIK